MPAHRKLEKALQDALSYNQVLKRRDIPARFRFDALRPYRAYPSLRRAGYAAAFLVRPGTTAEVAEVVHIARRFRVPVVPYGGGTGLMGAAIAVRGGILVDTVGMNRVGEISKEDMLFRAEAGVVLEDAFSMLDSGGLLFAHDPWTRPIATIGGAISTNSLGYLGAKFGSMGSQLLGVEAVLPNGGLLKTRPAQFSSTGLDLRRLFLGTEGIFGIVTSAVVRAFPKPEAVKLVSFGFSSFERAHSAISRMRVEGITPSMIDYGEEPGSEDAGQLNLEFDGIRGEVDAQVAKADQLIVGSGSRLDDSDAREFWEHRHDIALRFRQRVSEGAVEEPRTKFDYLHISLPSSKILTFQKELLRIARTGGVKVLEIGLWQGPELLSMVLSTRASTSKLATRRLWRTSNLIIKRGQDLGGAMEYCHGVGLKLAHLMKREHGVGLEVMRRMKRAIDPLNLMNPRKEGL